MDMYYAAGLKIPTHTLTHTQLHAEMHTRAYCSYKNSFVKQSKTENRKRKIMKH